MSGQDREDTVEEGGRGGDEWEEREEGEERQARCGVEQQWQNLAASWMH